MFGKVKKPKPRCERGQVGVKCALPHSMASAARTNKMVFRETMYAAMLELPLITRCASENIGNTCVTSPGLILYRAFSIGIRGRGYEKGSLR